MSRPFYPIVLAAFLFPTPLALVGAVPPAGKSRVFDYPIHQKTLPNGLKVVVVPFDSPGLVAHWVVVRVGSRNEIEPGHSGFAHFFEHMMFRGTERFPAEEYNAILKSMGADSNAFTSDDLTAYHILASADSLARIMEIESDRFTSLKYDEEAFRKEALAVLGEYNKNITFPESLIEEKLCDTAFQVHTYKHTTMGFLRDIQDMPNQYRYSLTFYDRYYRPEHGILLVVGDVRPEAVLAMAEKYYGPWKRGSYEVRIPLEPAQTEEKRIEIPWKNPTLPHLTLGYHAPAFSTREKEMPAMDLIAQIAFSETSPLYRKLVLEDQLVDSFFGSAPDHRDPHLFIISARVKEEEKLGAVQQAIDAAVEDLKARPVEAGRLAAVKSHVRYAFQMHLDTPEAMAEALSHILQLTGDPAAYNDLYEIYDSLTPEDIQEVARKYFRRENRTMVVLTQETGKKRGVKR